MKIICGLGNPGDNYKNTRHNAGFIFLDKFANEINCLSFKKNKEWNAEIAECGLSDDKIILVKPLTFMNRSGESISKVVNIYKANLSDLYLVYDDIDLPLGTIRFRNSGGPGTHNGMKSVINALGSIDFPRLRLGIESRIDHSYPLDAFVLSRFSDEEMKVFNGEIIEGFEVLKKALANI